MGLTVKRLHPTFMAQVDGVDLRQSVSPEDFAEIEAAFRYLEREPGSEPLTG